MQKARLVMRSSKLAFLFLAGLSSSCFAFQADLVGVEYYRPDKSNMCVEGKVLVTEVYRVDPKSRVGLKYKAEFMNGDVIDFDIKSVRANGDVTFDACWASGLKGIKQVWFFDSKGERSSQTIRVNVDTTQKHLILDANKRPLMSPM
jgi:hypothetical protein